MKKHPAKVVVNALLAGVPVKLDRYTYILGETPEGKDVLCFQMFKEPGQEEVLMACDLTVNGFLNLCAKLSEEELFQIGCSKVLTDIHRKKR